MLHLIDGYYRNYRLRKLFILFYIFPTIFIINLKHKKQLSINARWLSFGCGVKIVMVQ